MGPPPGPLLVGPGSGSGPLSGPGPLAEPLGEPLPLSGSLPLSVGAGSIGTESGGVVPVELGSGILKDDNDGLRGSVELGSGVVKKKNDGLREGMIGWMMRILLAILPA